MNHIVSSQLKVCEARRTEPFSFAAVLDRPRARQMNQMIQIMGNRENINRNSLSFFFSSLIWPLAIFADINH